MGLDELGDIPIDHPFRYHRELVTRHRYSQQWQHVLMAKGFPCHDLLAEPLHDQYQPIKTRSLNDCGSPPL